MTSLDGIVKPYTLGVSLILNPHLHSARVVFAAVYACVGDSLDNLKLIRFKREEIAPLLTDKAIRERAAPYLALYGDDPYGLFRYAMEIAVNEVSGQRVFAAFGQRNSAPYEVGEPVRADLLPRNVLGDGSYLRDDVYRMFCTGDYDYPAPGESPSRGSHLSVVSSC